MIVPNARFRCNGRITNVAVSMEGQIATSSNHPVFQVWHPTQLNSSTYNKIDEVQLIGGDYINIDGSIGYYYASMSLNRNSEIEFQSGDVVGYYQPSNSRRLMQNIQTSGYTSYINTVTSPLTSIDINNVDSIANNHQPLIEITFGEICNKIEDFCMHFCLWL